MKLNKVSTFLFNVILVLVICLLLKGLISFPKIALASNDQSITLPWIYQAIKITSGPQLAATLRQYNNLGYYLFDDLPTVTISGNPYVASVQ